MQRGHRFFFFVSFRFVFFPVFVGLLSGSSVYFRVPSAFMIVVVRSHWWLHQSTVGSVDRLSTKRGANVAFVRLNDGPVSVSCRFRRSIVGSAGFRFCSRRPTRRLRQSLVAVVVLLSAASASNVVAVGLWSDPAVSCRLRRYIVRAVGFRFCFRRSQ